jgi:replicative DNA helicase
MAAKNEVKYPDSIGVAATNSFEQAILGTIIMHPALIDQVLEKNIKVEHFAGRINQLVFAALCSLATKSSSATIDLMLVFEAVKELGADKTVTLNDLLTINSQNVGINGIGDYCDTILKYHFRRKSYEIGLQALEASQDFSQDVSVALSGLSDVSTELIYGSQVRRPIALSEMADITIADMMANAKAAQQGLIVGTPWGVDVLDKLTGGMRPGELAYIGARPGSGKTTFLANMAIAGKQDDVVLFLSLEMTELNIAMRYAANVTGYSNMDIRLGRLPDDALAKAAAKIKSEFSKYPNVFLYDESGLAISKLYALLRKYKQVYGDKFKMCIIDYLQLVPEDKGVKSGTREQFVSYISRSLKLLGKEFKISMVAASQLSRESAKGAKLPDLTDLRESGSLEQDANFVLFMYKGLDMYPDNILPDNAGMAYNAVKDHNVIGFRLRKSRDGKTAEFYLWCDFSTFKYWAWEPPEIINPYAAVPTQENLQAFRTKNTGQGMVDMFGKDKKNRLEVPPLPPEDDMPF